MASRGLTLALVLGCLTGVAAAAPAAAPLDIELERHDRQHGAVDQADPTRCRPPRQRDAGAPLIIS
jgi:hypothetical protein